MRGQQNGQDVDDFSAEDYRRAAQDRIASAQASFNNRQYVTASYLCGVAVECLLFAYLKRSGDNNRAFHHNLRVLGERSGFFEKFHRNPKLKEELLAALVDISTRWHNDHRYRSESGLRRFFVKRGLYYSNTGRPIKGEVVPLQSERLLEDSLHLISKGIAKW